MFLTLWSLKKFIWHSLLQPDDWPETNWPMPLADTQSRISHRNSIITLIVTLANSGNIINSVWLTDGCWLLTVDCWLLTVDCWLLSHLIQPPQCSQCYPALLLQSLWDKTYIQNWEKTKTNNLESSLHLLYLFICFQCRSRFVRYWNLDQIIHNLNLQW